MLDEAGLVFIAEGACPRPWAGPEQVAQAAETTLCRSVGTRQCMSPSSRPPVVTVALVGNPNTGKSTLFSALVGIHQRVGNYPGVTVEKKTGQWEDQGRRYEMVDLPGLCSLAPRSRDEMVTVDVLLGREEGCRPIDAVICIVDAANLPRHLYLLSQVLELGLPTVVALNMTDVAEKRGLQIDVAELSRRLGVPVIPMQAHRRIGIAQLRRALADVLPLGTKGTSSSRGNQVPSLVVFPEEFRHEVDRLESVLAEASAPGGQRRRLPRYLVERLLLDVNGYLHQALLSNATSQAVPAIEAARARLAEAGHPVPTVETAARHAWADRLLQGVLTQPARYPLTASDRIDRVLTHRVWGSAVFLLVMLVMFQAVFVWAEPLMDGLQRGVQALGGLIQARMAEGALRSLLVDGVLAGVGGVLAFLPQIAILFLFIAVLEDCGYMARAAYLMDRWMVRIGLSGKSFIPLLSSFACAVPGVMAARVVENERDRLTTILAAPLITCSARLPVYALLIAAFIPPQKYCGGLLQLQGLTLAGLYALGILAAILVALLLKKTLLRGEAPLFLMELPSYKWPSPRNVLHRVLERAVVFVRCAGTLILAVSILVWAALYYPPRPDRDQRHSLLGRAGQLIEPVFRPLGWDWRISSAVIASLPAREVVVATLGIVYNLGEDLDAESDHGFQLLRDRLHAATWDGTDRPVFTIPVALSIMVFFALCAQCAATLAVVRRETNSWRWPLFMFAYMTLLAYCGALTTYWVGTWLSG